MGDVGLAGRNSNLSMPKVAKPLHDKPAYGAIPLQR